jgi:UDP-glucuronate 4-epimerase
MALFKFAAALFEGRPIDIYNHGNMSRDFTYVDDLVEAMLRLLGHPPPPVEGRAPPLADVRAPPLTEDSLSPVAPWRVVNIGAAMPIVLMDFVGEGNWNIALLHRHEIALGPQSGRGLDGGDTSLLLALTGFAPKTQLKEGVKAFIAWHRDYFGT